MYKLKSIAMLSGACLALGVMSANAADAATRQTCLDTAHQVQSALDSNPQSPNYSDASRERRNGLEFCNAGMYQRGVDHYQQALKLLEPAKENNG
jgi:hypothetical protein